MTGDNEMKVNQQTMIQIVQEWIDRAFTEGHRQTVDSVKCDSSSRYGEAGFIIEMNDNDRPGPTKA